MSINWALDAEPSPALLVLPPAAASLDEAHAAIELWEHYSGKTLDPTQRLTVEVMMAETADGRWAAATTGREMSRQNGKGDEIEVPELWGLVQRAEAILHTVHDAVLLATQTQQRMLAVLESHSDLRRRIKRVWRGTGQQMIEMRNGGVIWYRTRTGSGGRGVDDIDRLVVDEAQHANSEQMASVTPTLLANANPQMNALGSAGIAGASDWWWGVRKRALSSDPGAFGYIGHTAEQLSLDAEGNVVQARVDPSDRSLWPGANPAVATGRAGGTDFLEEQFHRLGPDVFAREHLCVWDAPGSDSDKAAFPIGPWTACIRHDYPKPPRPTFALEVDPDGTGAAIAASDGTFGQVLEWDRGSLWVPAKLHDLLNGEKPWLDPKGPAGALLPALADLGIEWNEIKPAQYAQACGSMYSAVVEDQSFAHASQQVLNIAVEQATRRSYGDAWVWDRRTSRGSVAPLGAVTIARWAALQATEAAPVFVAAWR